MKYRNILRTALGAGSLAHGLDARKHGLDSIKTTNDLHAAFPR